MNLCGGKLEFTVSHGRPDDRWDHFLTAMPSGQFQQSSLWARVKAAESWECARLLAHRNGHLAGGAQMLYRSSRLGRIGYVSKGPVLTAGAEDLLPNVLEALHSLCSSLRLRAWILQPPDEAIWQMPALERAGYLPCYPLKIIDATLLLDLSPNWDNLYGNMRKSSRHRARQADRQGIRIRVGTESDIGLFFDLMSKTCQRQKTEPNPSSVSTLLELWRAFQPSGRVRLTFAEVDSVPLAGLLCLIFNRRVTLWKKGWNSDHVEIHPNELLHMEAIKWAWQNGYDCTDFVALDRGIAEAVLSGLPLTQTQLGSRHLFNMKLGARPRLLPRALLFVANPIARAMYRGAGRFPSLTKLLRKLPVGVS